MEAYNKFFNEGFQDEKINIISVKSHLELMGFTEYYKDFEKVITPILDKLKNYPEINDLFLSRLEYINPSHRKWHSEPYGWHALCCGLVASHYATIYGASPRIAFKIGFLHDIGKPFVETKSRQTPMHGQIGAHIAELFFEDEAEEIKKVALFLIDQHMCYCTHRVIDDSYDICYQVLNGMIENYDERKIRLFSNYYKCLIYGDRLGIYSQNILPIEEVDDIVSTSINHILNTKTYPSIKGTIYLLMHGGSGCGKTFATEKFKKELINLNMSVGVAERDKVYWQIAKRMKLISDEIWYENYVNDVIEVDGIKTTYYKLFKEKIKKQVPEAFKNIIEDLRDKHDVVIIDSSITIDQKTLANFITPNDMVFVWCGFPQYLLGRGSSNKYDNVSYPIINEGTYYRSIIEGIREQVIYPLVSSSRFDELVNLIKLMWKNYITYKPIDLEYPTTFLNNNHTLDELKSFNKYLIIEDKIKLYSNSKYDIIRLSYMDGTQNGNGNTLNYRGETIMRDKKTNQWYPLRVSLPVTPETGQLRKFNSHAGLYNYLIGLKEYLKGEFTTPIFIPETNFNKCYILPKVDGSLMTASIVKTNSIQGDFIQSLKGVGGDFYFENDEYIVFIGSKSCLFASQASSVSEDFKKSICASFGDINNFCTKVIEYSKLIDWKENISIIFEVVPEHPYNGLTVDYGRAFTIHLATVYFDGIKTKIILPDKNSNKYFQSVEIKQLDCNTESITKYYHETMTLALDGKFEDLEGFMLAFKNDFDDLLYVKLKFPWYYASHKPDTNFAEAEELSKNPKYDKIRNKLINLELSANKREARRNPEKLFEPVSLILIRAIFDLKNIINPTNKKDFMLGFFARPDFFKNYTGLYDSFEQAQKSLYIELDVTIEKCVPSLYDKVILKEKETVNDLIKFVAEFIINHFKIKSKY